MFRGVKNIQDVGRISTVNDRPTMNYYKEDQRCNVIDGTDKLFFPPFQTNNDVIQTYSHDACKMFPLRYAYATSTRGAKTTWKSLDMKDPLVLFIRIIRNPRG